MSKQPDIIISDLDLAAIERQLEKAKLPADFVNALEQELYRATIVTAKDLPTDVVALGSQVTFKILNTNNIFTKTLCFPADMNKHQDGISIFAPIGSALLGLKAGQNINWQTLSGQQSVEIVQVQAKAS